MTLVTLDKGDFSTALYCGCLRSMESILRDREDSVYKKSWIEGTKDHILGACGEIAVLKYLGIYGSLSINGFGQPDIQYAGQNIEVRHRALSDHDLIVRRRDSPSSLFVLTRGSGQEIEIAGWEVGKNIMKDPFIKNHGGHGQAWFVPASALRKTEDLIDFLRGAAC